jgi:hypothetical protein
MTKQTLFSLAAYALPARSFSSFREAAAEAAISRMYGGIHYRKAVEEGAAQGLSVGELVLKRIHTRVTGANAEAPAASSGEQALANLSGH